MAIAFRPAVAADVPALLEIYNEVIVNSTAIWTEEPRSLEQHQQWFAERTTQGFPILVATQSDNVIGYASYGLFRAWPGYAHTVENSVYLAPASRGRGAGTQLLARLLDHAKEQGLHTVIAGIDGENIASVRLHERAGFTKAAHLREVGRKFDRWLDLLLYQRLL
jgi:L-amino acid N-acyltransferase